MNTSYLYERNYFQELLSAEMTTCNGKLEWNTKSTRSYSEKADEVNRSICGGIYKKGRAPRKLMFTEQSFALMTSYPGLLVGAGNIHSAQTGDREVKLGFSIDFTTGLPVIPGSTVKGMLRSAFINHQDYVAGCLQRFDEKDAIKKLEYEIFGDYHHYDSSAQSLQPGPEERGGTDVFFDAVPVEADKAGRLYGVDYVTPHKAEHGMDGLKNPIPLKMFKVLPGVTYLFRFSLKDGMLEAAEKLALFRTIICDLGIGAKTNTGYGIMLPAKEKKMYYELEWERTVNI